MPTRRSQLGKEGEDFACNYLRGKKWKIIGRNIKIHADEIDVIARTPDKTLVFVEVKTMRGYYPDGLRPENQMTNAKLIKLRRSASLYAGHNQKTISEEKGWRLDVMALTKIGNDFLVNHYENI